MDSAVLDVAGFNRTREGQAEILFPKTEEVFYNPVQEFNRDLRCNCNPGKIVAFFTAFLCTQRRCDQPVLQKY
jgi:hypothetical protein